MQNHFIHFILLFFSQWPVTIGSFFFLAPLCVCVSGFSRSGAVNRGLSVEFFCRSGQFLAVLVNQKQGSSGQQMQIWKWMQCGTFPTPPTPSPKTPTHRNHLQTAVKKKSQQCVSGFRCLCVNHDWFCFPRKCADWLQGTVCDKRWTNNFTKITIQAVWFFFSCKLNTPPSKKARN